MSAVTSAKKNVSQSILDRLKTLDDLPHFPNALFKLERVLAAKDLPDLDEVVQMVAQDPRLTAGIIGIVNTAKYSSGQKTTDLAEAIMRIGIKDIRVMAHAINYQASFKTKPPFSEKLFLKHALLSAFIAQNLAKAVHLSTGEAFLCGLMRDIGIYLLAVEDRERYQQVITLSYGDNIRLPAAETQFYDTQHPIMSARLLQQWKFPHEVIMGVANHHTPEKSPEAFQAYAYLTYLSEYGGFKLGFENGIAGLPAAYAEFPPERFISALEYFGLAEEVYDEILEQTLADFEDMGMH